MILEANTIWNFRLHEISCLIQYTEYHESDKGCYVCHYDISSCSPGVYRKISVIVQLSHHDEYDGGDVILSTPKDIHLTLSKDVGDVILFPSYMPHEVKPVERGKRTSLVMWILGPPFQ